jgi:hypothetical protein
MSWLGRWCILLHRGTTSAGGLLAAKWRTTFSAVHALSVAISQKKLNLTRCEFELCLLLLDNLPGQLSIVVCTSGRQYM